MHYHKNIIESEKIWLSVCVNSVHVYFIDVNGVNKTHSTNVASFKVTLFVYPWYLKYRPSIFGPNIVVIIALT